MLLVEFLAEMNQTVSKEQVGVVTFASDATFCGEISQKVTLGSRPRYRPDQDDVGNFNPQYQYLDGHDRYQSGH